MTNRENELKELVKNQLDPFIEAGITQGAIDCIVNNIVQAILASEREMVKPVLDVHKTIQERFFIGQEGLFVFREPADDMWQAIKQLAQNFKEEK